MSLSRVAENWFFFHNGPHNPLPSHLRGHELQTSVVFRCQNNFVFLGSEQRSEILVTRNEFCSSQKKNRKRRTFVSLLSGGSWHRKAQCSRPSKSGLHMGRTSRESGARSKTPGVGGVGKKDKKTIGVRSSLAHFPKAHSLLIFPGPTLP